MTTMPAASPTPCRLIQGGRVWTYDDDSGEARAPSYALAQDQHGVLWVSSEDGPRLFDGLTRLHPAGLDGLHGYLVNGFTFGGNDTLWMWMRGAGLAHIAVGSSPTPHRLVARLTAADGLPSNEVRAVCVDHAGRVWAGTDAGLARIENGVVTRRITVEDGLAGNNVAALGVDERGRLWVGTERGLAVICEGTRISRIAMDGDVAGDVSNLCRAPDGQMWVALRRGDILRADVGSDGAFQLHAVHSCGAEMRALLFDRQGRAWVGTGRGVIVLDDGVVCDSFCSDDGLPVNGVWALCCDGEGRIWAGTNHGLALLSDPSIPISSVRGAADVAGSLVFSCTRDRQRRMWVGTEVGVRVLDGMNASAFPLPALPPSLAEATIWALQPDSHGAMWVGTEGTGLFCVDAATGSPLAHVVGDCHVRSLHLLDERYLWAGTVGHGVVCVDVQARAQVRRIGSADGLPHGAVHCVRGDRQSTLWAGTQTGWLACIDGESGTVVGSRCLDTGGLDTGGRRVVNDISCDPTGLLWVATHGGGLLCLDPVRLEILRVFTTRDGLPSDVIYSCWNGPAGHIWVGTARGVGHYNPGTGLWATLGRSLGLPSEDCSVQALYPDDDKTVWVGTAEGVGIVALDKMEAFATPCRVYLTSMKIMGRERAIVPDMEIEDSDYDLLFEYGSIMYTAASQVVYRVQLVGLESDWSPPATQRSARYTNLRPGRYTFRVMARDWRGCWSEPLEISFRVIRNRKVQEAEAALEQERIDKEVYRATAQRLEQLNRQMEETDRLKSALLEQIRLQVEAFERLSRQDGLTGLLNRRALDEKLADEVTRARRHGRPLTIVLADLDHFKSINDTYLHQIGDQVLQQVAKLCRLNARAEDSVGRYGGEEIAFILPETTAQEGLRLCERVRQAVENYAWETIAPGLRVTLSLGLATWTEPAHPETLLAQADTHLYRAKHAGRNRTCSADCTEVGSTAQDSVA